MQDKRFENLKRRAEEHMKQYDAVYVTEYMEMNCREERMTVLKQADRLLKQVFVFEDKWDISPNGDPEWIYMLNRHEYLHKLLLAYCFM